MLKKDSKVKLSFVKEKKQGAKGGYSTSCSIGMSSKTPDGWANENYNAVILGDYNFKDGDKIIVKEFGISQNKYNDKTYYNIMIFAFEFPKDDGKEKELKQETKKEIKLEPIEDDPLPF